MKSHLIDAPGLAPGPTERWLAARSRREMAPGAVLFHAPSFVFQAPGGGENQLVQTARHLERLGVPIRLFSPWTDRLGDARLLHLFGMSREGLELARAARAAQIPIVLSPICWFEPIAMAALERDPRRKVASLAAYALRRLHSGIPGWRRELLHLADAVLPNSRSEAHQLARLFGVDKARIHVVPNGVDPAIAAAQPEPFHDRFGDEPFVLFVGRVEPRKNTLALIKAVRGLGLTLAVIGAAHTGFPDYARECRRAGGASVRWLGPLDHHDPLLASAYRAARVFALPSWFETPGLAALEAAVAGAPVVITPFGSTRDYFGDMATYARPYRVAEIRRCVADCWEHGAHPALARWIASQFLWPKVARITAEVYDQVAR